MYSEHRKHSGNQGLIVPAHSDSDRLVFLCLARLSTQYCQLLTNELEIGQSPYCTSFLTIRIVLT